MKPEILIREHPLASGFLQTEHSESVDIVNLINQPELLESLTLIQLQALLARSGFHESTTTMYGSNLAVSTTMYASNFVTRDSKLVQLEVDKAGRYSLCVIIEDTNAAEQRDLALQQAYRNRANTIFLLDDRVGMIESPTDGWSGTRISDTVVALLSQVFDESADCRNPVPLEEYLKQQQ